MSIEDLVRLRLRSTRLSLGWSLDELAARTNVSASTISRDDVKAYRTDHADLLAKPNHFMGGWRDGDDVYLDVSVRAPSKAAAKQLAVDNHQLAVFDIGAGTVIDTAAL